ncbi:MAG: hypothetical protein GQ581_01075 [Methyloprofundus sp.]|nr:hypothetical protein [Methyloprofundus sp.]
MNHTFLIYGRRLIVFSILLLIATVTFSYYIDPFSVYGRTYIKDGVQVNSPGFHDQITMGKALAIKQRKPEILILGSSRSSIGFSPQIASQYFPEQNIYNGSFPGINIYELLRYSQHAIASAPIKQLYIGLDFYQFHGGRPTEKSFREDRLAVDVNNQPAGDTTGDLLATLLSVDAIYYSIKVALGLYKSNHKTYLTNGFLANASGGGWLDEFMNNEGKAYINKTYTVPKFTFNILNKPLTSFDYFKQLVQLAHQHKIKLYFFISPSHARQWEVIDQLGLWNKWEYWKREMLRITEQESKHFKQAAYPIYDFSGYSNYSTEAVPRMPGKTMQWYFDSSHYRQSLGSIIFDHIINPTKEKSFGRILSSKNIDIHLQSIRVDKRQYQASHTQDVSDIRKLIEIRNKMAHTQINSNNES